MRTYLVLITAIALASCATDRRATEEPSTAPPNIVFIMADDLGYGDIGLYGQRQIRTPHLDRMAAEGTRFTQFYAGSTVCAPSRSVLLTGLHTGHTPIRGNKEVQPIGQEPLPAEAVTVANVLRQAGYATGAFGKWGLGYPGSEGVPTKHGFDEFYGYLDQRRAHFFYPEFLFRGEEREPLPNKTRPDPRGRTVGSGWAIEKGRYSHDAIAEEALAFIERNRDVPFFLYVPFTIPHVSLEVPKEAMKPYLDENGKSIFPEKPFPGNHWSPQSMPRAAYAAMITRMDRDIGRILDRLRKLGLDENTVVFFCSDNGPERIGGADPAFFRSSGPLRGIKRDLYEGGIRVPMIAWGPGRVPAGRVSEQVWAMWDVLPTAAELARTESPPGIDGLSMVHAITGQGQKREHEYLYWEFYERDTAQAVRMGKWKAIRKPMLTGEIELYDLERDLGEERDIASKHPEIVQRMRTLMEEAHTPSPLWKAPEVD